jgi:hypothetical protein
MVFDRILSEKIEVGDTAKGESGFGNTGFGDAVCGGIGFGDNSF